MAVDCRLERILCGITELPGKSKMKRGRTEFTADAPTVNLAQVGT
jgi:hypothetical protein